MIIVLSNIISVRNTDGSLVYRILDNIRKIKEITYTFFNTEKQKQMTET